MWWFFAKIIAQRIKKMSNFMRLLKFFFSLSLRYDCSKKSSCSNYMFEDCNCSKNPILFQLYFRRLCLKISIFRRMQFCSNYMFGDYVWILQLFKECNFVNMHFEQKVSFDHYLSNTKLEHVFPDQPYSRDGGPMWGFFVKIIAFYKLFTLKKNKEEEQFCEVV